MFGQAGPRVPPTPGTDPAGSAPVTLHVRAGNLEVGMRRTLVMGIGSLAVALGSAGPALAAAPHAASIHKQFSEREAGVQLSMAGTRFEDTYRIKASPFGEGTTIRDATLTGTSFPASGKDTATSYYKDGRLIANETFTLAPPAIDGVGAITGTGTCSGGTFKHQGETCTYTIRGSYDLITGVRFMTLTGTYTPAATPTKKGK